MQMLANSQFAMFITTEKSFVKSKIFHWNFVVLHFLTFWLASLIKTIYLLCHFSSFIGVNCNSWQVARYNLLLRLFVSDNYISDIEQFDLKSLSSSLKTLILAGNSLTSVPEGRAHLRKLNIASPFLKSSTFDIKVRLNILVTSVIESPTTLYQLTFNCN